MMHLKDYDVKMMMMMMMIFSRKIKTINCWTAKVSTSTVGKL